MDVPIIVNPKELKEGQIGRDRAGNYYAGIGGGRFKVLSGGTAHVSNAAPPQASVPAQVTADTALSTASAAYVKPAGGIPETDMDSTVSAKIDKAHDRQHSITSGSDHTFPGGATTYLDGTGSFSTPATSGGMLPCTVETGNVSMVVNHSYVLNRATTVTDFLLPATAAVGDAIELTGINTAKWKITQNANQYIHALTAAGVTTTGTGGSVTCDAAGVAIYLRCVVTNNGWKVFYALPEGQLNYN